MIGKQEHIVVREIMEGSVIVTETDIDCLARWTKKEHDFQMQGTLLSEELTDEVRRGVACLLLDRLQEHHRLALVVVSKVVYAELLHVFLDEIDLAKGGVLIDQRERLRLSKVVLLIMIRAEVIASQSRARAEKSKAKQGQSRAKQG
jgi:hypothetical protein